MKKNLFWSLLWTGIVLVSLNSCKKDDDPAPEGVSCTVLIYGAGGGGEFIDETYAEGLIKSLQTVQPGKINLVGEYNFRESAQNYANLKGTRRFALAKNSGSVVWDVKESDTLGKGKEYKENFFNEKMNKLLGDAVGVGDLKQEVVNETPIALYEKENIAAFIDWAADKYPADRYVFVISGHGGAWSAKDDSLKATKAAAWDDNNDELAISAKELVAGIKASTVASDVEAIITDACNMNMMENVTEYATTGAKYAVVSFQYSYGVNYAGLLEELSNQKNSIEGLGYALLSFSDKYVYSDWTLWDLMQVVAVNADMKTAVNLFKDDYPKHTAEYDAIIKGLKTDNIAKAKDRKSIHDFWCQMAGKALTDELKAQSKKVAEDIGAATETYFDLENKDRNIFVEGDYASAQALFLGKTEYTAQYAKYKDSFDNNEFYKQTGWNTLFEIFSDDISK